MIGSTTRQASLFYFAFAKEVMAITDDVLDPLDSLLQDPQLVQLAAQALAQRRARSADFGRPSIAPDRLLRCVILKHVKNWSFRQLERELRASLLRSEEHTSELQSHSDLVCRLLLEKKKKNKTIVICSTGYEQ